MTTASVGIKGQYDPTLRNSTQLLTRYQCLHQARPATPHTPLRVPFTLVDSDNDPEALFQDPPHKTVRVTAASIVVAKGNAPAQTNRNPPRTSHANLSPSSVSISTSGSKTKINTKNQTSTSQTTIPVAHSQMQPHGNMKVKVNKTIKAMAERGEENMHTRFAGTILKHVASRGRSARRPEDTCLRAKDLNVTAEVTTRQEYLTVARQNMALNETTQLLVQQYRKLADSIAACKTPHTSKRGTDARPNSSVKPTVRQAFTEDKRMANCVASPFDCPLNRLLMTQDKAGAAGPRVLDLCEKQIEPAPELQMQVCGHPTEEGGTSVGHLEELQRKDEELQRLKTILDEERENLQDALTKNKELLKKVTDQQNKIAEQHSDLNDFKRHLAELTQKLEAKHGMLMQDLQEKQASILREQALLEESKKALELEREQLESRESAAQQKEQELTVRALSLTKLEEQAQEKAKSLERQSKLAKEVEKGNECLAQTLELKRQELERKDLELAQKEKSLQEREISFSATLLSIYYCARNTNTSLGIADVAPYVSIICAQLTCSCSHCLRPDSSW